MEAITLYSKQLKIRRLEIAGTVFYLTKIWLIWHARINKGIDMTREEKNIDSVKDSIEIPIRFNTETGKQSVYATNLLIQASHNVVLMSFFEEQQPVLTGKPDELETLAKTGIRADCVAKLVVPQEKFADFVVIMQELAKRLESRKGEK